MKKLLYFALAVVAVAMIIVSIQPAEAAVPSVYDINGRLLHDGDVISANQSAGDPDIYIIGFLGRSYPGDILGYKRLFLNPEIFNMYGHLGGFANVRQVTTQTRDSFTTTGLFRNCESNDQKVWATEITGEDSSVLHHVQMTGEQASAEDYYFFGKVFCINTREENSYVKSITPYYRLADIPPYFRRTCRVRPDCLSAASNRCLIPEPVEGWCPILTPLPPLSCYPLPVCALPGSNPTCDLSPQGPDGRPWCTASYGMTMKAVDVSALPTVANPIATLWIAYSLPTACHTARFTHRMSTVGGVNQIDITGYTETPLQTEACAQVITDFGGPYPINMTELSSGTYRVYVNGQYWTSFTK